MAGVIRKEDGRPPSWRRGEQGGLAKSPMAAGVLAFDSGKLNAQLSVGGMQLLAGGCILYVSIWKPVPLLICDAVEHVLYTPNVYWALVFTTNVYIP